MMDIRLYERRSDFCFTKNQHCLSWSKKTGELTATIASNSNDEETVDDGTLMYPVYGVIGKMRLLSDDDWRLIVITRASCIGSLPHLNHKIYKVDEIVILSQSGPSISVEPLQQISQSGLMAAKRSGKTKEGFEKLEKRLVDALLRMFNGSESFYFSYEGDLTNSLQRNIQNKIYDASPWEKEDSRFFWNKHMLADLLGPSYKKYECDPWILPVIQGYIEIQKCSVYTIRGDLPTSTVSECFFPIQRDKEEDIQRGRDEELLSTSGSSDGDSNSDANNKENRSEESPLIKLESPPVDCDEQPTQVDKDVSLPCDTEALPNGTVGVAQCDHSSNGNEEVPLIRLESPISDDQYAKTTVEKQPDSETLPNGTVDDGGIGLASTGPEAPVEPNVLSVHHQETFNTPKREAGQRPLSTSSSIDHLSFYSGHFSVPSDRESDYEIVDKPEDTAKRPLFVVFMIISRRSRFRAGMRYKRRGGDTSGAVANYVETEYITTVGTHSTSIVMVRGSVPILWSQPGYKYKPTLVLDKDFDKSSQVLEQHFVEQLSIYHRVCIINTLNQTGQERKLVDAYEEHLLKINTPDISYVAFDFHKICHGSSQIQNVQLLLDRIDSIVKDFKFFWLNTAQADSILCLQDGVIRVNCMDCLDRTNVVQSYIAKEVLTTMLLKLGLLTPDIPLSPEVAQLYNDIWANNGDTLSMQYAGTSAMKGDLTRYGERKILGMMKDGYNSAHRYLLNIFRDKYQQIAIDLMLGQAPSEVLKTLTSEGDLEEDVFGPQWSLEREQVVLQMIERCRSQLYPYYNPSDIDGWALSEPAGMSFLPESDFEENIVLLLYKKKPEVTVANFDISADEITSFIRIPINYIDRIDIGSLGNMIRNNKRPHIRIHYTYHGFRPTYFTFKTIAYTSVQEDTAILEEVAATLAASAKEEDHTVEVSMNRIERRKCPPHYGVVYLRLPKELLEGLQISKDKKRTVQSSLPSNFASLSRGAFSDDELLERDVVGDQKGIELKILASYKSKEESPNEAVETSSPAQGSSINQLALNPPPAQSVSAPISPVIPARKTFLRVPRKEKSSPSSNSRSRSPSPARESRSSSKSLEIGIKGFDRGFSKLKEKLTKITHTISAATQDLTKNSRAEEEDEAEETRREELWRKSDMQAIFML